MLRCPVSEPICLLPNSAVWELSGHAGAPFVSRDLRVALINNTVMCNQRFFTVVIASERVSNGEWETYGVVTVAEQVNVKTASITSDRDRRAQNIRFVDYLAVPLNGYSTFHGWSVKLVLASQQTEHRTVTLNIDFVSVCHLTAWDAFNRVRLRVQRLRAGAFLDMWRHLPGAVSSRAPARRTADGPCTAARDSSAGAHVGGGVIHSAAAAEVAQSALTARVQPQAKQTTTVQKRIIFIKKPSRSRVQNIPKMHGPHKTKRTILIN